MIYAKFFGTTISQTSPASYSFPLLESTIILRKIESKIHSMAMMTDLGVYSEVVSLEKGHNMGYNNVWFGVSR